MPRAHWINIDTDAALAVVRYILSPPTADLWLLRLGLSDYLESGRLEKVRLRNVAFKKAVDHAEAFIYGVDPR